MASFMRVASTVSEMKTGHSMPAKCQGRPLKQLYTQLPRAKTNITYIKKFTSVLSMRPISKLPLVPRQQRISSQNGFGKNYTCSTVQRDPICYMSVGDVPVPIIQNSTDAIVR